MGSVLLDNVEVGEQAIIGAGSLLTQGTRVPARSLVLGRPGRVVRLLDDKDFLQGQKGAQEYVELARRYAGER
jgi:carbonic anhydrase/acetyltransferase-like protein (isoleucine patch superfamily)